MQIERVQKWVMTSLLLTTAAVFAVGLCFLAAGMDRDGDRGVLLVVTALVGVLAIAGARVINELRVLTPWLLVGLLPAVVGWYVLIGS